jgi:hypothetical protein
MYRINKAMHAPNIEIKNQIMGASAADAAPNEGAVRSKPCSTTMNSARQEILYRVCAVISRVLELSDTRSTVWRLIFTAASTL